MANGYLKGLGHLIQALLEIRTSCGREAALFEYKHALKLLVTAVQNTAFFSQIQRFTGNCHENVVFF